MKNTPLANKAEKLALIEKIAVQFPGKAPSRVDWRRAFEEHPEWEQQLDAANPVKRQKLYSITSAHFREKETGGSRAAAVSAAPPPSESSPPLSVAELPLEQKEALLREVMEQFPPRRGRMKWKQIFSARPEVKAKFGITDSKSFHRFTYWAAKLTSSVRKTRGQSRSQTEAAPPPAVLGVPHCPNCGFYLELFNQAFVATKELQSGNGHVNGRA